MIFYPHRNHYEYPICSAVQQQQQQLSQFYLVCKYSFLVLSRLQQNKTMLSNPFSQFRPVYSDGEPCKENVVYENCGTWSVTLYIVLKYASFIY